MGEVVYGFRHYRSTLGILKILEIFICLLAVILVSIYGTDNTIKAFYAGTIIGIILSLIIFVLSSTEAGHSLNGGLRFQCYIHCILFLYIFIISSIVVARYGKATRAGGVFGLVGALAYLIDALVSYKAYGNRLLCC